MDIIALADRESFETNPKLAKAAAKFQEMLNSIREKVIPESQVEGINEIIDGINHFDGPDERLLNL